MEWRFFKDKQILAQEAYDWIKQKCIYRKINSIYIPAGNTPLPLYQIIETEKPDWLDEIELLQVDEIITDQKKGYFKDFLHKNLPTYKDFIISPSENHYRQGQLGILGLGENGHIAFHEPELPDSFKFGKVDLSEITKEKLGLDGKAQGLSYGAEAFLQCQSILLLITGESKKEVVAKLLAQEKMPASLLLKHEDITILCEKSLRPG